MDDDDEEGVMNKSLSERLGTLETTSASPGLCFIISGCRFNDICLCFNSCGSISRWLWNFAAVHFYHVKN